MRSLVGGVCDVVVAIGWSTGCTERADKALCERAADRLVEVAVAAKVERARTSGESLSPAAAKEAAIVDAKDARAAFMKACPSSPRSQVACIEEASDLAAVEACQTR